MPVTHIAFNRTLQHGSMLSVAIQQLESGVDRLNEMLGTMAMMLNGDGSVATHYNYMTTKYGFPDDVTSMAAYQELNSLMAKLNSDASVTNVHAALEQAFSKFR